MVSGFDRLMEEGRKLAQGEIGWLRIGFGFHTFELVPRLIARLRQVAPSCGDKSARYVDRRADRSAAKPSDRRRVRAGSGF